MKTVKVYQYRVKDPITGRRYLTRYKLTEEEAAERYAQRERLDYSEEARTIYDGDAPISFAPARVRRRKEVLKTLQERLTYLLGDFTWPP